MKGLAITDENLKNQQGVVGNEVKSDRSQPALRRFSLALDAAIRQLELV